jgi:hypothetical protein
MHRVCTWGEYGEFLKGRFVILSIAKNLRQKGLTRTFDVDSSLSAQNDIALKLSFPRRRESKA